MADGRALLVRGNALHLPFPDGSVHCIVTSPPFHGLRDYKAGPGEIGSEPTPLEFLEALWAATREMARVLHPSGSIFVNLGDSFARSGGGVDVSARTLDRAGAGATARRRPTNRPGVREKSMLGLPWSYALGCTGMLAALGAKYVHREVAAQLAKVLLRDVAIGWLTLAEAEDTLDVALSIAAGLPGGPDPGLNLILRAPIVLRKRNGLPESVRDRVRIDHEYLFHLVKEPSYYSAVDELREPYSPVSLAAYAKGSNKGRTLSDHASNAHAGPGRSALPDDWRGNPLGKQPGSVWDMTSEPLVTPDYMLLDGLEDMDPQWVMDDRGAWKLLRAGLVPPWSVWPRVEQRADGRRELRVAPAHYAAFPSELPRRCILGWSPPGICVACGEGRWPVVDRRYETDHYANDARLEALQEQGFHRNPASGRPHGIARTEATILGYACRCTPFTDHPGSDGRAIWYGKHLADGKGYPPGRLEDAPKVGLWREFHLAG